MAEFIYTMRKARKAHGDKVILDDVTLSFLPGAKIGVVGPNGAGKSTVLKIMAGMEHASNGDAFLSPGYSVGILEQEPAYVPALFGRGLNYLHRPARLVWPESKKMAPERYPLGPKNGIHFTSFLETPLLRV